MMFNKLLKAHLFAVTCYLLLLNNSFAATGDELIIIGDIVNLRSAPSTNADAPIKLLKGHKVIEIQYQGDWVEVETLRNDIKTGWLHKSLVRKAIATASSKRFNYFMQRFNEHNEASKTQNGFIYFSEAKDKGDGTLEVIATEAWLDAEREQRESILNNIFKLWNDVVPVGRSMAVIVFDEQGEQHMLMLR